ncbi:MAG: hypothetical protein ACR2FY_18130 [Pirellulaceae bacterium]
MAVPCLQFSRRLMLLALVAGCLGCGTPGESNREREDSGLKPLAIFYGRFVPQHQGKPPKDEAEFKAYLKEPQNAEELKETFNIADIEAMFISSRDKKPYIVIYGPTSGEGPAGAPVVAYEQIGLEGKRFVASTMGAVEEVDEARFKQMLAPTPAE